MARRGHPPNNKVGVGAGSRNAVSERKRSSARWLLNGTVGLVFALIISDARADTGWPVYRGGPERNQYSPLKQINRKNVKQLQVAWVFDTGEAFRGATLQCNPIVVGGVIYMTSPRL